MAGSQKIIWTDNSEVIPRVIEIGTRPTSLWRLVPFLGQLAMFRLGAPVSFRLDFKMLSKDVADRGEDGGLHLRLLIQGNLLDQRIVSFPYPQRDRNTFVRTEGLLPRRTGT